MIIAHLPSGYILGHIWRPAPLVMPAAIIGSVLPDFDLLWFYFIDDRAFHHHRYWVHIPFFWACMAVVGLPATKLLVARYFAASIAFFASIFLHICLDTLAGGILWHWPLSDHLTHLITVPARFDNWVLNFVLHPVFLLEILIWCIALGLFVGTKNART